MTLEVAPMASIKKPMREQSKRRWKQVRQFMINTQNKRSTVSDRQANRIIARNRFGDKTIENLIQALWLSHD
jgi:hypothetical protein